MQLNLFQAWLFKNNLSFSEIIHFTIQTEARMKTTMFSRWDGFLLLLLIPVLVFAGPSPKPIPLQILTSDGKSFTAPVLSYKGLSLGVVATLIKQGKMKKNPEQGFNSNGDMTFVLDKSVSKDFTAWVLKGLSQNGGQTGATGTFVWVNSKGIVGETFTLKGIQVIQFTLDSKNTNGGTLVLEAYDTEAVPPINFNSNK